MSSGFLGQITMFGGNFAPSGRALCNGQLLAINQNQALFTLLGTTYGGNGVTTFALPNLQSQLPVHQGHGPGLSNYSLGQTGGIPSVTITQSTTPAHSHSFNASTTPASSAVIANNLLPGTPTVSGASFYASPGAPPLPALAPEALAASVCSTAGGNQAHTNLMPSLCITFIIVLSGVFPSRN
jgi:microcystin-dependent protein